MNGDIFVNLSVCTYGISRKKKGLFGQQISTRIDCLCIKPIQICGLNSSWQNNFIEKSQSFYFIFVFMLFSNASFIFIVMFHACTDNEVLFTKKEKYDLTRKINKVRQLQTYINEHRNTGGGIETQQIRLVHLFYHKYSFIVILPSSLHWSFDCFLCRFSSTRAYSE